MRNKKKRQQGRNNEPHNRNNQYDHVTNHVDYSIKRTLREGGKKFPQLCWKAHHRKQYENAGNRFKFSSAGFINHEHHHLG